LTITVQLSSLNKYLISVPGITCWQFLQCFNKCAFNIPWTSFLRYEKLWMRCLELRWLGFFCTTCVLIFILVLYSSHQSNIFIQDTLLKCCVTQFFSQCSKVYFFTFCIRSLFDSHFESYLKIGFGVKSFFTMGRKRERDWHFVIMLICASCKLLRFQWIG
jgi:hypothetical protein